MWGPLGCIFQWTMTGFMLGSRLKIGHYRLSSQNGNIRRELCMLSSSQTQWTHVYETVLGSRYCYQAGARVCVICWNSLWCQATDLPWCLLHSLQFISNICIYKRNMLCTLYLPRRVYFKLFMHVSQWSLAAVPMYPSHGAHWDTLPIPIKWSSANDSAAQV